MPKLTPPTDDTPKASPARPDKSIVVLTRRIAQLRHEPGKRNWPEPMKYDDEHAARWFIGFSEVADRWIESPRMRRRIDDESTYWVAPYTERLIDLMHRFLALSPAEQAELIAMRADFVMWRGESIGMMRRIYAAHQRMQGMTPAQKRQTALAAMRGLLNDTGDNTP